MLFDKLSFIARGCCQHELHRVGRVCCWLIVLLIASPLAGCRDPVHRKTSHATSPGAVTSDAGQKRAGSESATDAKPSEPALTPPAAHVAETLESVGFSIDMQMTAAMATVRVVNPTDLTEGSGAIVAVQDKQIYILTAAHIVNGAESMDVELFSAATYPKPARRMRGVAVIVSAAICDIALLRADDVPIKVVRLTICPLSEMTSQDAFPVMTVGCGNGKPPTPLLDHVIGSPRIRRPDAGKPTRFWELRDAQSRGRSGGPMLDRQLRVLGIGSGTSGRKGYFSHLTEIHAFLRDNGQDARFAVPPESAASGHEPE